MIRMFGQTREALQITEQDIRRTTRDIEAVRRFVKHMTDWTVTRDEAIEIATSVQGTCVAIRLANRAWRIKWQRGGRFRTR